MNMTLRLEVSPRAFRAGDHLKIDEQLAGGTCSKCPGRWRVLSRNPSASVGGGLIRVFLLELEPLDDLARSRAQNQVL